MRKVYWIILKNKLKYPLKDWRKIAVFAVIFITVILYGMMTPKAVFCNIPSCPQSEWITLHWDFCPTCSLEISDYLISVIYYAILPANLLDYFIKSPDIIVLDILLLVQIFYWYLLSYLIVWAYDKILQKLKSKKPKL
jgi:hypothetical protein